MIYSSWPAQADENPLLPANAASPRDTLSSFLEDFSLLGKEIIDGDISDDGMRAYARVQEMFDFSTTPHSASHADRIMLLLRFNEILQRIELPPWETVPNRAHVAEEALDEWTTRGQRGRRATQRGSENRRRARATMSWRSASSGCSRSISRRARRVVGW